MPYDDRIAKMAVREFFKSRVIRLHPLVILGSVLGLLAFLFDPFGVHPDLYSTGKMFGNYYSSHKPGTMQLTLIIIAALILLVGVAYLTMMIYDIPVRKYFSDKRNEGLAKQKTPCA